MQDLIVIGAGPGGYEAALYAARKGLSVTLVEKGATGGTCLNVGCIPTKTFLHSARVFEEVAHAAKYAVQVDSKPRLDMKALVGRKNKVVKTLSGGVDSMLAKAGVKRVKGEARLRGARKVGVGNTVLEAANVLLATGSRPARPPIPGIEGANVYDSTRILDLETLPASVAVIGGGVIGIEFASFFASVGVGVQVIEMLEGICPGIDGEMGALLQRSLKMQGVQFLLGARVQSISGSRVHFTQGGKELEVDAELILCATGRSLNVENLGLEATGVDFDRRGIKVDPQGRTNLPGLFACGDVTGRCLLAHRAVREGQVAVNN
ncbi:MAG: FAD-dependent oxidoreductase, partial [Planctomycetes bacterium]|nr:FAD-dependent oxidoreductase [Planctomycetota bacterium]